MNAFWQDLRFGWRMLAKNPGFTLAAVLLLALGLGANTTIFTVLNVVLLRPLAGVAEPERLVLVGRTQREAGFDTTSYPNYADYRDRNEVFTGLAAYRSTPLNLSTGERTERVAGGIVSWNYFDVLGVRPAAGRFFLPEEDRAPGRDVVAVVSHAVWVERWGGDVGVVGSEITLNGRRFTVVGVAAKGFRGAELGEPADIWLPLMMTATARPGIRLEHRDFNWLMMIARLKRGVDLAQARANLLTIARRLEDAYPRENRGKGIAIASYHPLGHPDTLSEARNFLGILAAVSGLVLLVVCANVGNLVLARGSARRREVAIRLAIGASRGRLVRQLLVEGLLLALLGAAGSLVVAGWAADLLPAALPLPVGVVAGLEFSTDWRVWAFALAVAVTSTLAFCLAPALQASRAEVLPGLRAGEGGATPVRSARLRDGLAVAQVAFGLLLLVASGLLARSLDRLRSIDPRMRTEKVLLATLDPSLNGHDEAAGLRLYEQLVDRVSALPGVVSATVARKVPFSGSGMALGPVFGGAADAQRGFRSDCNVVAADYFRTLGIPLVRGREFLPSDRRGAPLVAIVNETLGRSLWPNEDPLGKSFRLGGLNAEPVVVVGVAADSRYRSATERTRPFYYLPVYQKYFPDLTLHVRAAGSPLGLLGGVRQAAGELDRHLPLSGIGTLSGQLDDSFGQQRMAAALVGVFGLLATLLATIGLYAVMSYRVGQRTREIGLRMALGAGPANILRVVLRQGMTLAAGGLVLGVLLALASTRLLASLLYGVTPTDPAAFLLAAALLLATALAACWVPARRATRVDPIVALRYE